MRPLIVPSGAPAQVGDLVVRHAAEVREEDGLLLRRRQLADERQHDARARAPACRRRSRVRSWPGPSSSAGTSTGRTAARRQASIARLRTMLDSQALTLPSAGR